MKNFESYKVEETGRRFLCVCVCHRCGNVSSELYRLRCGVCGEIMNEHGLTAKEVMILTSRWN